MLVGVDLKKDANVLHAAYNDAQGVTAAFNLNLLARINRELDGDFNLASFHHEVRWDAQERRIEMHLRSTCRQTATIRKAGSTVRFAEGETIWTESSHKYQTEEVVEMAGRTGYHCVAQWVDVEWPFAQSLFLAKMQGA